MQKFWMLLVDGTTYPTRKHLTLAMALAEAERILNLKENWSKGITLLEAVDYGSLGKAPVLRPVAWEQGREHVYEYPEDFGE